MNQKISVYFLLFSSKILAFHLDVEKILLKTKCTIPIVNSVKNVSWNKPFILRNANYTNHFIKREMSIYNLLNKYGETTVGIDYPGSAAPPTSAWRSAKLRDYVKKYVLHNLSYAAYIKSDKAMLWGPSDSCEYTGGCRRCGKHFCLYLQKFVPMNVSETFTCYGKRGNDNMFYGLGGKFNGLNFHQHESTYNQLIYGKKLWYLIDGNYTIELNNLTSAETVYDMLIEELYPPHDACIQEEGDFIFVPDDTWHMTFNFEPVFMSGCVYDSAKKWDFLMYYRF